MTIMSLRQLLGEGHRRVFGRRSRSIKDRADDRKATKSKEVLAGVDGGAGEVRAQALDDPGGSLETFRGQKAVREATERLRRAGFARTPTPITDPATGRCALIFIHYWKKTAWVVIASWDGSLAYRLPAVYVDERDPFKVVSADELPETLRRVRWMRIGLLVDLVNQILSLPELPGHSHFGGVTDSRSIVNDTRSVADVRH